MNIIITGKGSSGSWQIRGQQLGKAIGAHIEPKADRFPRTAELIIAVKRIPQETLDAIRRSRLPWVWDIVDAWPQPKGSPMSYDEAMQWLHDSLRVYRPDGAIFATTRMLQDSNYRGPSMVLPHHGWPKYHAPIEIRKDIKRVGYEGGEHYLGRFRAVIDAECARRGWTFEVNAGNLQECDIGICLRDPQDYASQHWKSNCKLANMQLMGLPAICSLEQGYCEFSSGTELFIEDPSQVGQAFNGLTYYHGRVTTSDTMKLAAPKLDNVALRYKEWLEALNF